MIAADGYIHIRTVARNTDFGEEGGWQCTAGRGDDFVLQVERERAVCGAVIVGDGVRANCSRELVGDVQCIPLIRECAVPGPVAGCRFVCVAFGQGAINVVDREDPD